MYRGTDFNPDHYAFSRRLPPGPPFRKEPKVRPNWGFIAAVAFCAAFWYFVYRMFA